LPEESLTSWLARTARANAIGPHELLTLAAGRRHNLLGQDLDCHVPSYVVEGLSQLTMVSPETIRDHTIEVWAQRLVPFEGKGRARRWILPQLEKNRAPTRPWMQFCVECLRSDPVPYFRKIWRMAFLTMCLSHRRKLSEACERCGKPLGFLSPQSYRRAFDHIPSLAICVHCGFDFRESGMQPAADDKRVWKFERSLGRALVRGYGPTTGGPRYVQQILEPMFILSSRVRSSDGLRRLLVSCLGTNAAAKSILQMSPRTSFERWPIDVRHEAMRWLSVVFQNWPSSFVEKCEALKIRSYSIWGDYDFVPYWFADIVDRHLHRPWYASSEEEVLSVRRAIRDAGQPDTYCNQRRWLGRYYQKRPFMTKITEGPRPLQLELFASQGQIGLARLKLEVIGMACTLLKAIQISLVHRTLATTVTPTNTWRKR